MFSTEVRGLAGCISEIFPDTPVSYILHKCKDLDLVDTTIERITRELQLDPKPLPHWCQKVTIEQKFLD